MITLLDTSALAKLLVEEAESSHLRAHLAEASEAGDVFVISALAIVELRRLALNLQLDDSLLEPVLRPFTMLRITEGILQLAGRLPQTDLGTLEAIHVSTALNVEAAALITYDSRQIAAAEAAGLSVQSPGVG